MQGLFEVVACLSVVAPLTGIVGLGNPVQGGCTAVPERGWQESTGI